MCVCVVLARSFPHRSESDPSRDSRLATQPSRGLWTASPVGPPAAWFDLDSTVGLDGKFLVRLGCADAGAHGATGLGKGVFIYHATVTARSLPTTRWIRDGTPVKARFRGLQAYSHGTVVANNRNGTYDIDYEGGYHENNVPESLIAGCEHLDPWRKGAKGARVREEIVRSKPRSTLKI